MKKILLIIHSLYLSVLILKAQSPYPDTGSMDPYTTFVFSQYWLKNLDDQVFYTSPDMNIRAWAKWDRQGIVSSDFDFSIVSLYHQRHISFTGGITGTVYFFDEAADSAEFKDMVSYDASGKIVQHNIVADHNYRGNIANPAYRDYLVNLSKIQIDGGVDGIFYDEMLSSYNGTTYNGNEGFDNYTLKDFNAYLAAKYPAYTKSDWIRQFGMTDTNYINTSLPLNDLDSNFNYREYLAGYGWQDDPCTFSNPLAAEWGRVLDNRADTTSDTFLARYTTKYWRDIVTRARAYARTKYGKELKITSNGILPYVDFNSFGMYNYNHDDNDAEASYVPITGAHLNGSASLQNIFKTLYQKNRSMAGEAPLIVFIDWPTQMMDEYNNFPKNEKEDYWKIYAPEAYANGLFMAFHLRTAIPTDPTATEEDMIDFIKDYPRFFKDNAALYHKNQILSKPVTISAGGINTSLMLQKDSSRYTLHLVNHNYVAGTGMTKKNNFTVSLSLDSVPASIYVKSPDSSGYRILSSSYINGMLNIKVDELQYYDVIVLDYNNTITGIPLPEKEGRIRVFPNPSSGMVMVEPGQKNSGKYNIVLSDETGRIIESQTIEEAPLKFQLRTGVYFLNWSNDSSVGNRKIVIY